MRNAGVLERRMQQMMERRMQSVGTQNAETAYEMD